MPKTQPGQDWSLKHWWKRKNVTNNCQVLLADHFAHVMGDFLKKILPVSLQDCWHCGIIHYITCVFKRIREKCILLKITLKFNMQCSFPSRKLEPLLFQDAVSLASCKQMWSYQWEHQCSLPLTQGQREPRFQWAVNPGSREGDPRWALPAPRITSITDPKPGICGGPDGQYATGHSNQLMMEDIFFSCFL